MAELAIRDEATGRGWRVWPEAEAIDAGCVHETGSYFFELKESQAAPGADLLIDDVPLEALRATVSGTARWRWSPGFHAGTVEAELRLPGFGTRRFEVVTDPDRRKLTREDFDGMVREILEDTFALFALSGFRKSIASGAGGRAPPIARLEFLRSRIEVLEEVVIAIARRPWRILRSEDVTVPYHRAARATGPEILRSFRSGRIECESGIPRRLPVILKGFLPDRVTLRRRHSSLDLPEHRRMAACMRLWQAWLSASAGLLDRSAAAEDPETRRAAVAWAVRCRRLGRRVDRLCGLAPFAASSDAAPRLLFSSVFRNDPTYRRFYGIWQDINRGIAAVFGDFLGMPLARTFELYELWCFLRLVRAAVDEYGHGRADVSELFQIETAGGVVLRAGAVTVSVGSGWKLCFQRTYREFWVEPDQRGSFSRRMRPDLSIGRRGVDGPESLIVLDAKYRIEDGLADALNSIHTYRDALVREASTGAPEGIVSAAYLLAPHLPERDGKTGYRQTDMPGRLFHPEYRRDFRFGAVTLRPGMGLGELREVLRVIVADAAGEGFYG